MGGMIIQFKDAYVVGDKDDDDDDEDGSDDGSVVMMMWITCQHQMPQ